VHVETPPERLRDVLLLDQGEEQRLDGLWEQPVVDVAAVLQDRDAVIWLLEERQGRIVHQDALVEAPSEPAHVLHAWIGRCGRRRVAIEPMMEDAPVAALHLV
jgi:hypothetical protein